MQLTAELADELNGGQIILANGHSGKGQNLFRGTVLEVYPVHNGLFTVKYTVDSFAAGDINETDDVEWTESNGLATWSSLRAEYERDADGVQFNVPTQTGSTARIALLVGAARPA